MKNAQERAASALGLIMVGNAEALGSRAFDNCFEEGDGDQVVLILSGWCRMSKQIAAAVCSYPAERYMPPALLAVAKEVIA